MTAMQLEGLHGHFVRARHRSAPQAAGHATGRVLATLRQWRQRTRDRTSLATLDDRMLADIGITRADAEYLSSKPFWRE